MTMLQINRTWDCDQYGHKCNQRSSSNIRKLQHAAGFFPNFKAWLISNFKAWLISLYWYQKSCLFSFLSKAQAQVFQSTIRLILDWVKTSMPSLRLTMSCFHSKFAFPDMLWAWTSLLVSLYCCNRVVCCKKVERKATMWFVAKR